MAQQRTFATPDNPIVQRVLHELRADYKNNFAHGGTVFFERFPAFTVRYPTIDASQYPARFVEFVAANLTDRYAKDTLEKEFRCLNWIRECTHLVPLYTTGDGNCLLHAASLAMWGFEDKDFVLRNALYESLTTAGRNTNTLQDRCRISVSSMLRDLHVNMSDNDWLLEWQQIVNQARLNSSGYHQSLEESHIFVLANILRRPIIVYGVPKARSFNTGGTMQNINFHGIYLPLLWGSQLCHKPPLCLGYGMGHFTALVPAGNPQQQLTVPLTDDMGRILPIRFLLEAEERNTTYLLEQYLDVIKPYSSLLRRQISAAVIVIKEAAHMEQLVNAYINLSLVEFNKQNQPYYTQPQPAAASQNNTQHLQCFGCDSGVYATAETNFLCSICFKKQTAAAADYNPSKGLKCRSPNCLQQGLTSKDGYCNECYTRNRVPTGEQYQWNNFDAGKTGNPAIHNPTQRPAGGEPGQKQKCYKCKDFFANEEYHGLCSECFKKLTIEESQPKPQFSQTPNMQVQPNPNNNVEPVANKCKACKEFHGDPQFGGLCSVCFKNKSKEESVAKPPQQPLNGFQQNSKQDQFHQPQQAPPAHQQQPGYDQGRVNPPPVGGSPQQPNIFGFNQCISHGCARPAHEHCRGYCEQCFYKSVERYQQSQENQQKLVHQQDQRWQQGQQWQQQQDEQARRQGAEKQRLEQQNWEEEKMRQEEERQRLEQESRERERVRQEAERQRLEQQSREQERMRQEAKRQHFKPEAIRQQENNILEEQRERETIKAPQRNDFVSKQQQQQQRPRHAATAPVTVTGDLCANIHCGDFAVPNCNGYCSSCYSSQNPPADASPSHTPAANSKQRPPIRPRTKLPPKTEAIHEKPENETVETMSVGGRSQFESASSGTNNTKCFMCAKVKPITGDMSYTLCPAHAQRVMKSLSSDSQQPEASYTAQESSSNHDMHDIPSNQQRRTSSDYLQPTESVRYPTEQNTKHYSGEQHPTRFSGEQHHSRRTANHYSGEQVNRSPRLSGPQANLSNEPPQHQTHWHTEEHASTQQYYPSQVPRSQTTELPFGAGSQFGYPPNSKRYVQGGDQPSYQVNNPDQSPLGHQNAHQDDYSQGEYNSHRNHELHQSRSQDDVNERSTSYMNQDQSRSNDQFSYQPGQNSNHDNHRSSEIKYPPNYVDPSMRSSSQDYSPGDRWQHSSYRFNDQPPNQFNGAGGGYPSAGGGHPSAGNNYSFAGGGYPSASNNQYPQAHQQQHFYQGQNYNQQQYEQPGGGNQMYGRPDNYGGQEQYPQQSGRGSQGHGGAGNYGAASGGGAAGNYLPQGGSYREDAGNQQHVPPQKPSISSHTDPNATHSYTEDVPRAKVLCRYPGCSFYAIPACENYCQDCYDNKSGLKNYRRCRTPNCQLLIPASDVASYCDKCLVSTAR